MVVSRAGARSDPIRVQVHLEGLRRCQRRRGDDDDGVGGVSLGLALGVERPRSAKDEDSRWRFLVIFRMCKKENNLLEPSAAGTSTLALAKKEVTANSFC